MSLLHPVQVLLGSLTCLRLHNIQYKSTPSAMPGLTAVSHSLQLHPTFSKTNWSHERLSVVLCGYASASSLLPLKASGGQCKSPPLAERGRNWLPFQLWLTHLKRDSHGSFSIKTERGWGKWQGEKEKRKCVSISGNEYIPNIEVVMNIEQGWTQKPHLVWLNKSVNERLSGRRISINKDLKSLQQASFNNMLKHTDI